MHSSDVLASNVGTPTNTTPLPGRRPSRPNPCQDAATGATRLDAWIFASTRPAIADVWVAGTHLVTQGRHRDATSIRTAYRACVRRLALN